MWVARGAYQQLVAEAVAEPDRVRTVRLRARRPQAVVDCLAASETVDLAGVEVRPESVAVDGEHHVVLVGPARFVADTEADRSG